MASKTQKSITQGHLLHEINVDFSESDLALITALQINPRASWQRLSEILDVAPSTVSRRWQALVDEGRAWVTPAPGRHHLEVASSAFLLLRVEPGRTLPAARALQAHPAFGTIAVVTGSHDLMVDCFTPTSEDFVRLLMEESGPLADIAHRDVLVTTALHKDATAWRAGALAPASALKISERHDEFAPPTVRDAVDVALIDALAVDGRASWEHLAVECGIAPPTARRRVQSLLEAGAFSLRCDAAGPVRQGRQEVTLLFDVPAGYLDSLGQWFARRADCRVSAEVIGVGNLLVTLWVRGLAEMHEVERQATAIALGTRTVARHIEVATVKRLGGLLDGQGRRVGRVPLTLVRQKQTARIASS